MVMVPQLDGTVERFPQRALREAMVRAFERGRAYADGELDSAPPLHPLTRALLGATEEAREEFLREQGWGFGYLVSEEDVFAGRVERPGPEVSWSEDGTVCS